MMPQLADPAIALDSPPSAVDLQGLRTFIVERYGLRADQMSEQQLARFVAATAADIGQDARELEDAIIAAVTIGETHFYRHQEQFDWIRYTWLPQLAQQRAQTPIAAPIRILSAACSTGEEPYTLAAVCQEVLQHYPGVHAEIVAVDVNRHSIEAAHKAQYSLWSMRGVDVQAVRHWLQVDGQVVRVAPHIRQAVQFAHHNLIHPLPFQPFDLILCRNVLIYFHEDGQRAVWNNLKAVLAPTGVIVAGPSDPSPLPENQLTVQWQNVLRLIYHAQETRTDNPQLSDTGTSKVIPLAARTTPPTEAKQPATDTNPTAAIPAQLDAAEKAAIERMIRAGQNELAEHMLSAAVQQHPLDVSLHVMRALVAAETGDTALAVSAARKAAFLQESQPYLLYILATALEQDGAGSAAEKRYQWASEQLLAYQDADILPYSEGLQAGQLKHILQGRYDR